MLTCMCECGEGGEQEEESEEEGRAMSLHGCLLVSISCLDDGLRSCLLGGWYAVFVCVYLYMCVYCMSV